MNRVLILKPGAAASRRMHGPDKLTLRLACQPKLTHAAAIAASTGQPVLVTLRSNDSVQKALLAELPVSVSALTGAAEGMAASPRESARHVSISRRSWPRQRA